MTRTGDLRYADADVAEEYARCTSMLGCGRMTLTLADGSEVLGKVRGKMYKRVYINKNDLVLCERRSTIEEGDDDKSGKYDVVHKYRVEDERLLRRYGEISSNFAAVRGCGDDGTDDCESETIVFADDGDISNI